MNGKDGKETPASKKKEKRQDSVIQKITKLSVHMYTWLGNEVVYV